MDGAQTHGTHPWQNDWDRRSVLFKYASRTSIRQDTARCIAPEDYWDQEVVAGMTPEERGVMFGPCSAPNRDDMFLTVEEDGSVRQTNRNGAQKAA